MSYYFVEQVGLNMDDLNEVPQTMGEYNAVLQAYGFGLLESDVETVLGGETETNK